MPLVVRFSLLAFPRLKFVEKFKELVGVERHTRHADVVSPDSLALLVAQRPLLAHLHQFVRSFRCHSFSFAASSRSYSLMRFFRTLRIGSRIRPSSTSLMSRY